MSVDPVVDVEWNAAADGGDELTIVWAGGKRRVIDINDADGRAHQRWIQARKEAAREAAAERNQMTAREYTDLRKEFYSSTLRLDLTEGVKHRLKFHRDQASYDSTRVKAASILLDVVGSPEVVKAVTEACLAELKRRGRSEADGLDEKATQLRDAIAE